MIARDGGNGFIAVTGSLGDKERNADTKVKVNVSAVVDRSDRQRVAERTGAAQRAVVDVVAVQIAAVHVGPLISVARGNGYHGIRIREAVNDSLIRGAGGHAGHSGTEGQVDRVAAQHERVFDSDQIVGIVRAAALAEHLHNKQLSIGSFALSLNLIERFHETAFVIGDITVAGGNTGHVRSVVALAVVIVGDVEVAVNVVRAERHFGIDVQIFGSQIRISDLVVNVKVLKYLVDFVRSEQCDILAGLFDSVLERLGIEKFVVRIETGVNDSDPAAQTGISFFPNVRRTDHSGGARHSGFKDDGLALLRFIQGFNDDFFHTADHADGIEFVVGHVRRDHVPGQRDVPNYVKFLAAQDRSRDPVSQRILLRTQLRAVSRHIGVAGDAGGEAFLESRFFGKHDRYTDHTVFHVSFFELFYLLFVCKETTVAQVLNLGIADIFLVAGGRGVRFGYETAAEEANDHCQRKNHGQCLC